MLVFKIFRRAEWDAFSAPGSTSGSETDQRDGFIHLSTAVQLAETAARHFAQENDLVLLALYAEALGADLRWEPARGGSLFPHLYRPLHLADVLWVKAMPLGEAGHIFPEGVL